MPIPNQKPYFEKEDCSLALCFGLETYKASFPIEDLKGFALTQKKDEKRSISNWVEAWFEGFNWADEGLKVKHNIEYDKLTKKSPAEFMEWLETQSEDGNSFVKCGIFKDLKEDCLRMSWIEGMYIEGWYA